MVPSDGSADRSSGHSITVGERQPSEAIISAVAALSGTDPTSLPPLYDAVDSEALDSLYEHVRERNGNDSSEYRVTFPYDGYEVDVTFDGRVRLERSE